jgi:TonB-linked SusC/RagA family outer membrane protein
MYASNNSIFGSKPLKAFLKGMNYFITNVGLWPNFAPFKRSFWKLIMRVSLINIIILVVGINVLSAAPAKGQDFDKVMVVLELNNETIQSAIAQIQHQTDYSFIAPSLRKARRVILPKQEYNLKQILENLLVTSGLNLKYRISGGSYITIYEVPDTSGNERDEASITPTPRTAVSIIGRVTDATTSTPLPGVNVMVKGTTRGTATDADGEYALEVEASDILVFSSIGFKTTETVVAGKTTLDVALESDVTTIGEVVIKAGYWDVTEKENTGSIVRVTADQISKQPVVNPLQSLQGRLTGVYISPTSGVPGSSFTIQIRGKNSLRYDGNEPLYVVDGVPYTNSSIGSGAGSTIVGNSSPFNNIDPSSIESVEVLKDADATAIYGSQGANGVVLITTKKGKAGKTNVTANFSSGIAQVPHMIELLSTNDYIAMRKEAYKNDGVSVYPNNAYDINGAWDQTRYTDWQKVLIGRSARMTNANASISGGSLNTRFLVGGSFVKQTTVFPGDFAYQRGAAHFNFIHDSEDKKLQFVVTANFSGDNNNLPANDLVAQAVKLAPNAPKLFNDDGTLNWENGTWTNPFSELLKKYKAKTTGLFANSTLSYQIIKGLKAKVSMGYNNLQMKEVSTSPLGALNPFASSTATAKGQAYFGISGTNTWIVEPQLEFKRKMWLGDLTAFAATTFRESNQDIANIAAYGYTVDALIESLKSAPIVTPVTWSNSQYRYNAIYGRINYNIKEKYIINVTGRRDGSSRFGPNRQFANFGAVGLGWIFSNESFVSERWKFLSFGKLRGSFGTAGNDQIGDYQYLKTYRATSSYTGSGTSISPSGIANPNYAWEVNKKLEGAIELGFINDRIKLGINWYRNQSSNQLVGQSIPTMTGFSTFQANLPATVRNQGWEIELSTVNLSTDFFKWTSSFNLTIPTNTLVEYPDIQNSSYAYTYEVGQSTFATKKFHYLGVNPTTGVYQFEDKDQNGSQFDDADKTALTKVGQNYYGGFRNSVTWRGFELNVFIQFTKQSGRNYLVGPFNAPGTLSNQPTFVMQRWTETNSDAQIQKFTSDISSPAGYAYRASTQYGGTDFTVSDASFIRLQNVSLEWNFPRSFLNQIRIAGASIYAQGQNLFTISNYYGLDPQTTSFVSLPTLRVITLGAKISF